MGAVVRRIRSVTHLRNRLDKCVLSKRVTTRFKNKVKKSAKHRSQLISKLSEKPQRNAIWSRGLANFERTEDPTNLTS